MQTFTGTEYLKIDIANCFGLDKLSWKDRMHWFDNNEPVLEQSAANAKNPILFRKAVRAMRTVQANKMTNHIMGLDATASGLQIMSAMSGCETSSAQVNLINTGEREDVYQSISDHMNIQFGLNTTKELVKKPIMTTFYGSTAQPKSIFGEGESLIAFYQTLQSMLPGAYELMQLFQSYWQPNAEYHKWTLPDGHIAKVPVMSVEDKDIEIDEKDHMRFAYRAKVLKPQSTGLSLAANIVHSIDGWIVREMVRAAQEQGFWLAPIHDCFYASPNHMNKVRKNYITIISWLARNSQVSKILTEISGREVHYQFRNMKLSKLIQDSEYMLS